MVTAMEQQQKGVQTVKIPITLEPHGIFGSKCTRIYFNIATGVQSKTVMRLLGEFKT